jgi:hypothetical protein
MATMRGAGEISATHDDRDGCGESPKNGGITERSGHERSRIRMGYG